MSDTLRAQVEQAVQELSVFSTRVQQRRELALTVQRLTLDAVEAEIGQADGGYLEGRVVHTSVQALKLDISERLKALRLSLSVRTRTTEENDAGSSEPPKSPSRRHGGVMKHSAPYDPSMRWVRSSTSTSSRIVDGCQHWNLCVESAKSVKNASVTE